MQSALAPEPEVGLDSADPLSSGIDEQKKTLPDMYTLKYTASKYTATGPSGQIEKIDTGEQVVRYLLSSELNSVKTLEGLIAQFAMAGRRMTYDIDRAFKQIDDLRAEIDAKEAAHGTSLTEKQQGIDDMTQQLAQQAAAASAEATELRDQITSLTAQLEQVRSELDVARSDAESQITALTNRVNQRQAEIVRLNDRARPILSEGPDGSVLTAGYGTVIVDRGKQDWLMPGTIFTVLGRRKGGALYVKGTITAI